jgi:hypothetical protein
MSEQQNFANHGKIVPAYHYFLVPVLALNFVYSIYAAFGWFSHREGQSAIGLSVLLGGGLQILMSLALLLMAFLARTFALGVQDRVIRLEERLRYQQLLPVDLQPRINEFTVNQLVSLRFANDAELPELARKVLNDKINNRKAIKQIIQNWRADYQRI